MRRSDANRSRPRAVLWVQGWAVSALALGLCNGVHQAVAAQQSIEEAPQPRSIVDDYIGALNASRSGEVDQQLLASWQTQYGGNDIGETLRAIAHSYANSSGDTSALRIADYYLSLSAAERRAGWQAQLDLVEVQKLVEAGVQVRSDELEWRDRYDEVRDDLEDFLDRARKLADRTPLAWALGLAARLDAHFVPSGAPEEMDEEARDSAQRARGDALEALAIFDVSGHRTPRLEPLAVLGELSRKELHFEEARRWLEECLRLAEERGRTSYREEALESLLALAHDVGDRTEAQRILVALAETKSPARNWNVAREHATWLLHSDRPEAVLAFLAQHRAAHIDDRGEQQDASAPRPPKAAAECAELRGAALLRLGRIDEARDELAGLDAAHHSAYRTLLEARLQLVEGDAGGALTILDAASDEIDGRHARAQAWSLRGDCHLALGEHTKAVHALEKALHHAAQQQDASSEGAVALRPASVLGEWMGLSTVTKLARAHRGSGSRIEALRVIESAHATRLRQGAKHARLSTAELRAWAGAYEGGLVAWTVSSDDGWVAHLAGDGRDLWIGPLPAGRRAFAEGVRRLTQVTTRGESGADVRERLARELSEILFPPALVERLGGNESKRARDAHPPRVLFLVHDAFEALPLSLLSIGDRALDECCVPLLLPGLPPFQEGEYVHDSNDWWFVGDPRGAEGQALLPHASRELEELAALYPQSSLVRGAGLRATALEAALTSGACLHLATHLVASDTCGRGGLPPVGILLNGGEVYCADAIRSAAQASPLVVLTTCESARGPLVAGEGMFGVSRAFLEAGTRNVLATAWPIADRAGHRFARRFHAALTQGARPSEAAWEARGELREAGFPAADWCAFRAIGRD